MKNRSAGEAARFFTIAPKDNRRRAPRCGRALPRSTTRPAGGTRPPAADRRRLDQPQPSGRGFRTRCGCQPAAPAAPSALRAGADPGKRSCAMKRYVIAQSPSRWCSPPPARCRRRRTAGWRHDAAAAWRRAGAPAKDFASIVSDWNTSREKKPVLSANYRTFARSRLFLRLSGVHRVRGGGKHPAQHVVRVGRGGRRVGARDLRHRQARIPRDCVRGGQGDRERAVADAWQLPPREAAGSPFYVRVNAESRRVVAFGVRDQYLLLATREDLLAGALTLIATPGGASMAGEGWFARAAAAAAAPGDLRLVTNLEALVKEPHFRSYWVQGNITELKQYASSVSDLVRTPSEIREERVFLRAQETACRRCGRDARRRRAARARYRRPKISRVERTIRGGRHQPIRGAAIATTAATTIVIDRAAHRRHCRGGDRHWATEARRGDGRRARPFTRRRCGAAHRRRAVDRAASCRIDPSRADRVFADRGR